VLEIIRLENIYLRNVNKYWDIAANLRDILNESEENVINNEEVYDANFLVAHNTYLENSQVEAIVKF
jgi:hypothetical protein